MWSQRRLTPILKSTGGKRRNTFTLQRRFQWRYTLYLVGAVLFGMLLAGGPTLYFLNHNYRLFIDLAYDQSPDLLDTLERERIFINGFLLSTLVGVVVFCIFLGLRMTSRIVGPVAVLERHLQKLARGQWYHPKVRIRSADEFHQLIETYNYFYASLQHQVGFDLDRLKKLSIDKEHRDARYLWNEMMEEKAHQIQATYSINDTVAPPAPDPSSLRVS